MNISGLAAIVRRRLGPWRSDGRAAGGARREGHAVRSQCRGRAGQGAEIGGAFAKVDVTDASSVEQAIAQAEERYGKARILVNCAGIAPPAKVISREGAPLPLASFAKIININLIGTFNVLSQFAARIFDAEVLNEDGERGIIVNTASVAAFDGQIGQPAYAASKGGVVAMALPIAREFARYGIRVNTIAPGIFWTPMLAGLPQEAQDSLGKQTPFPSRLGHPNEYAKMVEAMIANPMLNGEVVRLDGAIRLAAK
jgi:NAD(P)-dependent dehydrogenase (short-subunit alcohol dehydrogenase family)